MGAEISRSPFDNVTRPDEGLVNTLTNIANAARRRGSYDEALAAVYEGLELPKRAGGRAGLLTAEGLAFEDLGTRSKAYAALQEARSLFAASEELEGVRGRAMASLRSAAMSAWRDVVAAA